MDMATYESAREAETNLISAHALLLEYGPQVRMTKREMDVFELGVYLGQVATIENQKRSHRRLSTSSGRCRAER